MKEIMDGILEAIKDEEKAQKHYKMLAENAEDPKIKNFFEQLRQDEEHHEKVLRTRYEAFEKMIKAQEQQ